MLREIVVEVGAEGGSITLVRERNAEENWLFRVETDETTMIDALDGELSEEVLKNIEFTSQTGCVRSFDEADRLLDKYPWLKLHPLEIHPEFLEPVLLEVKKRGGGAAEARWREKLQNRR